MGLPNVLFVDMKAESDQLYSGYLHEAILLSLGGLVAIIGLLLLVLRSPMRVVRIIAPLAAAVITVTAGLAVFGQQLIILHLVGLLLVVAVGSNYALFFDRADHPDETTSHSTDETPSHSTRLSKNDNQVAGYKPASGQVAGYVPSGEGAMAEPKQIYHTISPRTLASMLFANLTTVAGFGLLSFSNLSILQAMGVTVAPGVILALIYSAIFASRPNA
jgi:predicted exporter